MKKLHVHYDMIVAWAAGAQIQCKSPADHYESCNYPPVKWIGWHNMPNPTWDVNKEYRIKPEEKSYGKVLFEFFNPESFYVQYTEDYRTEYKEAAEAVIQEFCKRNNLNRSEMK